MYILRSMPRTQTNANTRDRFRPIRSTMAVSRALHREITKNAKGIGTAAPQLKSPPSRNSATSVAARPTGWGCGPPKRDIDHRPQRGDKLKFNRGFCPIVRCVSSHPSRSPSSFPQHKGSPKQRARDAPAKHLR